jgi:hypothetical protein
MIYSVVLNSELRSSGSVSNAEYTFNWGILPESKYKLSSKFISSDVDLTSFNAIPMLYVDLGQTTVCTTNTIQTSAMHTKFIGILQPNITNSTNCFLFTDSNTNPCIQINDRPRNNNNFYVKIMTNDVIPVPWTDYKNNSLTDYILILTFERI